MNILLFWGIRLLASTWRYKRHGDSSWRERLLTGEIVAHWHGHLLPLFFAHKGLPFVPIISSSRDGDKLAALLGSMGYEAIRGSSSRNGKSVYEEAKQKLKAGVSVIFAVDGPRGPKHIAKPGALRLSAELDRSIMMLSIRVRHCWTFSSWDGFVLPKPFATVDIFVGVPFCATSAVDQRENFSKMLLNLPSQATRT